MTDNEKAAAIAEAEFKGAELRASMDKMHTIMAELGIIDIESATSDQMIALSEGMFGKK